MSDLYKKLNQVLEKDKESVKEAPVAESEDPEKVVADPIRKVRKAEEQVSYLSELFQLYMTDNVMLEYPELFTVERVGYREASRRPEIFGSLKASAEHRLVAVTFKTDNFFYVRFSAVILSRELEVMAYFWRRGAEKPREYPVELARYREGLGVDWKQAFEGILFRFLEWYESTK
jgi:hypothetical protein